MASAQALLSDHNSRVFSQLDALVASYPIDIPQLENLILDLQVDRPEEAKSLVDKTDGIFKHLLMTLLKCEVDRSAQNWEKRCGLPEERLLALKSVLQAVCGGKASHNLKRASVISFIQNVLECLGVSDLTEVLDVISAQIPRFASQLEKSDQLKLLRVINVLLKTVSKTEDYHLRGRLHLALTRFLPLCDQSGFHFRAPPAKTTQWESLNQVQETAQNLEPGISYEFYESFWELQKWLLQWAETPLQGVGNKLKKIEHTLREVLKYFETHPSKADQQYYTQPIKFLKNYNLLGLQLQDSTFRKTIMLQILFFTHSVTHPLSKGLNLSEPDKRIVLEIEALVKGYLGKNEEEGSRLLEMFPKLAEGELEWCELKEQWKERKKPFLGRSDQFVEEEAKTKEENKKTEKEIERRRIETRKLIAEKMKIESTKIQKFLQNKDPINLQEGPTSTSFSYFFSQAENCLQSFDRQNGKQNEFETRAQYNMFEWKAMRSLYRENIKDIWSNNDKAPPKMKDYRLISLMSRKEEDFSDPEPSKKLKLE